MSKIQAVSPSQVLRLAYRVLHAKLAHAFQNAEIIDMGGHAMKAKIISMIITAIVSIATVVSAIFAVLSYIKM